MAHRDRRRSERFRETGWVAQLRGATITDVTWVTRDKMFAHWATPKLQKGGAMKFMAEYSIRPGSSCDETAENLKKLLNAFGGWTQPAGLTIHAFVGKVEAMAGYVLCEADDPKVLAGWAAQYMSWNDVRFIPVIDVEDGVEAYAAGLNWFSSATN